MNVNGANILITGGAGTLGSSFAFDLASQGARILVCDRNKDALSKFKQEASRKKLSVDTFRGDISQENDVEDLFTTFLIRKKSDRFEKFPLSRWQRGVDINLTGVFLCGREGAFHMIRQGTGGVIINMSSVSRHGNFIQSNYSATKAAIVALTVVWSKELSRYGIRSVALAPGYVNTPFTMNIPEDILNNIVSSQIPLGRLGEISEITHAMRFIIENDYLNGRVIDLDGGFRV
jgi:3-oxoacyl-[acyl-carrier protein] reductase